MGFRLSRKCRRLWNVRFLGTILLALGAGMIIAILFPLWVWVLIIGIALIIIGYCICH